MKKSIKEAIKLTLLETHRTASLPQTLSLGHRILNRLSRNNSREEVEPLLEKGPEWRPFLAPLQNGYRYEPLIRRLSELHSKERDGYLQRVENYAPEFDHFAFSSAFPRHFFGEFRLGKVTRSSNHHPVTKLKRGLPGGQEA